MARQEQIFPSTRNKLPVQKEERGSLAPINNQTKNSKLRELQAGIFNLSNVDLDESEISLLNKGLKFAPTKEPNDFALFLDLQRFLRKLSIKKFFYKKEESFKPEAPSIAETDIQEVLPHTKFKRKSTFFPTWEKVNNIKVFGDMLEEEFREINIKKNQRKKHLEFNLNRKEREALNKLQAKKDLVFRQADKGGGIIIQNRADYVKEAERILSDKETYQLLTENPTKEYLKQIGTLLEGGLAEGILSKEEFDFLFTPFPRLAILYHNPKIHKSLISPPGRPIISGIGSLTANLSEYIDSFLQKYVPLAPSYIKDTGHFMEVLQGLQWKETYILASLDVTSLYTVIEHEKGLLAVDKRLEEDPEIGSKQRNFLCEAIRFCLTHNFFGFQNKFYLQKTGTAMGAKFAPGYANIFVAHWEQEVIWENNPFRANLALWRRFIDDIFIVWEGGREDLDRFFDYVNTNNMDLKFTIEVGDRTLNFLDLNIFITDTNFCTKTFFKPTDKNSYINYNSCHHKKWLNNIPKNQFGRIRRNCTKMSDFIVQSKELSQKFCYKQYPNPLVEKSLEEIKGIDRSNLLQRKPKSQKNQNNQTKWEFAFLTKFNGRSRDIEKALSRCWPVLQNDQVLSKYLPAFPRVIYRKANSVKNSLAPSCLPLENNKELNPHPLLNRPKGFFKCKMCSMCRDLKAKVDQFKSIRTGKEYYIKEFINCNTTNVVYLLQCGCGAQYIGKTKRKLKERIYEHFYNIRKCSDKHSVSRHCCKCPLFSFATFSWLGIEKVKLNWRGGDGAKALSQAETKWIFYMDTLKPPGLNVDIDLLSCL
uniref:GIY-YIG domain-containing protein n=1 Tax=Leptobrachium leishanense TaxID=445787 RepID=A0A8C5QN04_9ANUR